MNKYKNLKQYLNISIVVTTVLLFIKAFTYKPEIEFPSPEWIALGVGYTKPDYLLGVLIAIYVLLFVIRIIVANEEQKYKYPTKNNNSGRIPRRLWWRCRGR